MGADVRNKLPQISYIFIESVRMEAGEMIVIGLKLGKFEQPLWLLMEKSKRAVWVP